jgi:hypothetical protein
MMMPHPTLQRDFWQARAGRLPAGSRDRGAAPELPARDAALTPSPDLRKRAGLRVAIGHALIGAGSRLSGERIDTVHPPAHHRAA